MLIPYGFGLSPTDSLVGHFSFNWGLFENGGVGETDPSTGILSDKKRQHHTCGLAVWGEENARGLDSLVPFLLLESPSPLLSIPVFTLFLRF